MVLKAATEWPAQTLCWRASAHFAHVARHPAAVRLRVGRAVPFRRSPLRMPAYAFGPRAARRPANFCGVHAALVCVLFFAVGCQEKPKPQRSTPVVATKPATRGPLPYVIVANGEVEANRTVSVQSLVSGMLVKVGITEGDEVKAGAMLFQIDPRPFRAELDRVRGLLARDQAQLVRARADSDRFSGLAKDGYITRQALDQAYADASALSATVAGDKASVEKAQLDLDNTTVRAPIAGRTGQLAIKAGNLVRAQSDPALVVINELRPVLVRFSVPERDFQEMRKRAGLDKALAVKVTANSGDTTQSAKGELTFINNVVDRSTASVLLKARVSNENRTLWPGQFVTVGLELSIDSAAITVPAEAVVTTAAGSFVYVVDSGSKAKRITVKVGRQSGGIIQIDTGLVGGEQVIVEGQSRLTNGAKVEIRSNTPATGGGGRGRSSRGGGGKGGPGTTPAAVSSAGDSGSRGGQSKKGDSAK